MTTNFWTTSPAFIPSSKRRKGYPSETRVKRGARCVHGDKELLEKLGWKDPCPCGSGRRFQELLHALWMLLTGAGAASEGEKPHFSQKVVESQDMAYKASPHIPYTLLAGNPVLDDSRALDSQVDLADQGGAVIHLQALF